MNEWFVSTAWNTKWAGIQRRAGIRPRRPYQTRHTYACWCLTARGNLPFIAKQMGHKDFTMLVEVYAKWMDDESPTELQHIWQGIQARPHQRGTHQTKKPGNSRVFSERVVSTSCWVSRYPALHMLL
nr:tyrosine-type recombinase/integrase [Pseudomonas putida]